MADPQLRSTEAKSSACRRGVRQAPSRSSSRAELVRSFSPTRETTWLSSLGQRQAATTASSSPLPDRSNSTGLSAAPCRAATCARSVGSARNPSPRAFTRHALRRRASQLAAVGDGGVRKKEPRPRVLKDDAAGRTIRVVTDLEPAAASSAAFRSSRSRLSGELVFLIADVRGYTSFTRERGDAEAARLAARFAGLARDIVDARGGQVIELRGDEALAVFESPANAVRAASELVAACGEETAADPQLPLLIGIGGDVGEAVPVEDGFRGAALNTAARLCSQATGGQVLVSSRLAERAGEVAGMRFESVGMAELKGFETPVELIEVVAEPARRAPPALPRPPAEPLPIELEAEAPLVGRARELSWLRGTWRQVRRGYGRIVFVSGQSGIGKSRLAAELAAFARELEAKVVYAGAGGAAAALAVAAVREVAAEPEPTLLVLDDLDLTAEAVAPVLNELFDAIESGATMVVGLVRDPDTRPELAALRARADGAGDGHGRLRPLEPESLREIARFYVGEDVLEVPLESIARASAGVPGRVHELMSEWAEQEATRRLSAAAEWLAARRRERSADLEFANNVIGLKLGRIYGGDGPAAERGFGKSPYKGLSPFQEDDAALFFGRERLVGELAARTVSAGLLAVVGASGSGKSSAIAAGLLPSLRAGLLPGSERWRSAVMRPGQHPLSELEALRSAADGDGRLVLVVDQFEEVFTACRDEEERARFVERLVSIAGDAESAVVVIGVRGDYYGHCGMYPELATLVAANQVLVGPMSADELRRAIELPARRAGVRVESALAETLVEEVAYEPGGLPLLSTALVELWVARSDGWLRLDTHERLGGVRVAVARLAEGSYENLAEPERAAVHRLFLRLVTSGEDGVVARRRVARSELDLERDPLLASVVDRLTEDRLLTAQGASVEVAHEALLREWPRVQEWLAEDAHGRELREHLTESAQRWQESGRDDSELYRGARLSATLDWASTRAQELNELEREYLDESRRQSELEVERQRRVNRRLRILLAGVAVLLLAAVVAGALALVLRSHAQRSATRAEAQRLGSQALVQNDLDRSLLLAREGVNLDDSVATRSNLLAALLKSPSAIGIIRPLRERLVGRVDISSNGRRLLVGDDKGRFAVIDSSTRRVIRRFDAHRAALSRDGTRVALLTPEHGTCIGFGTCGPDGTIRFLDVDTGKTTQAPGRLSELALQSLRDPALVELVSFSPNLKAIALPVGISPGQKEAGMLVSSTSPVRRVALLPPVDETKPYVWMYFSSESRYLVAGEPPSPTAPDAPSVVSVWRLSRPDRPSHVIRGDIATAALSRDGRSLAIGGTRGSVGVFDLRTGERRSFNGRHDGFVQSVAFSPDERTVVSTGDDGRVLVWDVGSGSVRATLTGHQGRVYASAFSPDGNTLYTDGVDGSVIVWSLSGEQTLMRAYVADAGSAEPAQRPMVASPDGRLLAFGEDGGKVIIRDAASMRRLRTLDTGSGGVNTLAFGPDSRLVTETHRGSGPECRGARTLLWDARAGHLLGELPIPAQALKEAGPCADIESLTFSPDGKLIAGGYDINTVFLWDSAARRVVGRPLVGAPGTYGAGLAFSPDGRTLAVAFGGPQSHFVSIYRLRDRQVLYRLPVEHGSQVAYSPDGRLLATSSAENVLFWNAGTGRRAGRPLLQANRGALSSLEFSADGKTLLVGGSDGGARLYDVPSRTALGTPLQAPNEGGRMTAVFSKDGKRVIVGYIDGRALFWDVDPAAWKRHACSVAGRSLTRDEWDQFLPDRDYAAVCERR